MKENKTLTKELFRYARIQPPKILDLNKRLMNFQEGKEFLQTKGRERLAKANSIINSEFYVTGEHPIAEKYCSPLNRKSLKTQHLPVNSTIEDYQSYRAIANDKVSLKEDLQVISISLFSAIVVDDQEDIERLSYLLQLVESYPQIERRTQKESIAPTVTSRLKITNKAHEDIPNLVNTPKNEKAEEALKSKDVINIWNKSNALRDKRITELEQELESQKSELRNQSERIEIQMQYDPEEERKTQKSRRKEIFLPNQERIKKIRSEIKSLRTKDTMSFILNLDPQEEDWEDETRQFIAKAQGFLKQSKESFDPKMSFCDFYKQTSQNSEEIDEDSRSEILAKKFREIGADWHALQGSDQLKSLGEAELIKVEETWLKYTVGEISAVETVMKNEKRSRTVDTEKIFEQSTENYNEETVETTSESETKTTNELSNQIDNEIQTQLGSSIDTSVSGSGGGSFGVVDFSGEGSAGASISAGVDTSISTSNASNFSSEILSRALENTKKFRSERRFSRTVSKFANSATYEIDNTKGATKHINSIYTYLDKQILITETLYGIRQFLICDLITPGLDLIKQAQRQYLIESVQRGELPEFNITPLDINESNYMLYAGKYKASNISPPPPTVKHLSRTYKTDITNLNSEQDKSKLQKVVDVLVPFFGKYKRFLIQDNIEIPEGYRVIEVRTTVTHGSNGVSIPTHLPFSLTGALIYAAPKLAISAIPIYTLFYLPIALTEIMYLASPILHYNSDSSNVTINIGHQTRESPYYFFQPEILIDHIQNLISGAGNIPENTINLVRGKINDFFTGIPGILDTAFATDVTGPVNNLKDKFTDTIEVLAILAKPWTSDNPLTAAPTDDELKKITDFIKDGVSVITNALQSNIDFSFNVLLDPLKTLFDEILAILGTEFIGAIRDILEDLRAQFENSDHHVFSNTYSLSGSLPVSLNCIALKPGITINLTACMLRVDEQSLDEWRLETYERLYQGYYQLEAEYQNKMLMAGKTRQYTANPRLMREEEVLVIKDRVLKTLKNLHSPANTALTLEEIKLFEHAIDWKNMSYRLYNYGPKGAELIMDQYGFFKNADLQRKRFMKALWSQALIPLKESELLESQMMAYIHSGQVTTLDDLIDVNANPDNEIDEIAAIYQNIILKRNELNGGIEIGRRVETVPTDYIVLYEGADEIDFPVNSAIEPEA